MNTNEHIKSLVSDFISETKSTNVLEFITWFDCKYNKQKIENYKRVDKK